MEESGGRGHGHQRCYFCTASGLTKHHYSVRIAAKLSNVLTHPAQSQHQVKLARVTGVHKLGSAKTSQIEIAKGIETMIDSYHYHSSAPAETHAVIKRTGTRAIRIGSAVNVEHDRALTTVA